MRLREEKGRGQELVEGVPKVSTMGRGASPDGGDPPETVKTLARAGAGVRLVSGAHLSPLGFGSEGGGKIEELVDVRAALGVSAPDDAKDRTKGWSRRVNSPVKLEIP